MSFDQIWWPQNNITFFGFLWKGEDRRKVSQADSWTLKIFGATAPMAASNVLTIWINGNAAKEVSMISYFGPKYCFLDTFEPSGLTLAYGLLSRGRGFKFWLAPQSFTEFMCEITLEIYYGVFGDRKYCQVTCIYLPINSTMCVKFLNLTGPTWGLQPKLSQSESRSKPDSSETYLY